MDILKAAVDIATIISLGVASFVAIKGLSIWREQARKKSDRKLARQTLKALYAVRDAIGEFRSPIVLGDEQAAAIIEAKKETPDLDPAKLNVNRAVYVVRWRWIANAVKDLSVALLEVEALWGKEEKDKVSKILDLTRRLYIAMMMFLENEARRAPGDRDFTSDLYGVSRDDFAVKLDAAVEGAEGLLKDKMRL